MRIEKFGKYYRKEINEFDAFLYNELANLIETKSAKLADRIPEFILYESMTFFILCEDFFNYEIVKDFTRYNEERIIIMTREEWLDSGWKENEELT